MNSALAARNSGHQPVIGVGDVRDGSNFGARELGCRMEFEKVYGARYCVDKYLFETAMSTMCYSDMDKPQSAKRHWSGQENKKYSQL